MPYLKSRYTTVGIAGVDQYTSQLIKHHYLKLLLLAIYCSEATFRDQCCWSRMFDLYTVKYC